MLKKVKICFLILGLSGVINATPLDDIKDLSEALVSSKENRAENKDMVLDIFSSKREKRDSSHSGMKILLTDKNRQRVKMDISLRDVLSQVTGEHNSENMANIFKDKENSKDTFFVSDTKSLTKNSKIHVLPDRVLELNYHNLKNRLVNFCKIKILSKIDFSNSNISSTTSDSKKILYLTFDDGPIKGTKNVLDILEQENVDATMFCVGKHILRRKYLFIREKQMSNLLVANHTYSHADGHYRRFYSKLKGVLRDIEHGQVIVGGKKFLRLAGRNVWRLPKVKRDDYGLPKSQRRVEIKDYDKLSREGYHIVGWDVEWGFNHRSGTPNCSAQELASRVERVYHKRKSVKNGKIILLTHDFMFRGERNSQELRDFIRIMKSNGWEFRKIDHYVSSQPEPLKYAKYYKPTKKDYISLNQEYPLSKVYKQPKSRVEKPLKAKKHDEESLHLALNNALKEYDAEKVNSILSTGIDPNHQDRYGRLALNTAIKVNSIIMVKKLIAHGAKLTAHDKWGNTPISIARKYHRKRIQRYLNRYRVSRNKYKIKRAKRRVHKEKIVVRTRVVAKAKVKRKRADAMSILRTNPL